MSTARNILVVGAGQLGSRHLQGLAQIGIPVSIDVVDPSPASLETARERFAQMQANPNVKDVRFLAGLGEASDRIDLAVIATAADVRAKVIADLLADKQVASMILEKVLFQKREDFERVEEMIRARQVKTVVNCPRRVYPFYRELKKEISGAAPVTFRVEGSHWGMACNIIHFLDLFAFLTGDPAIEIVNASLDGAVIESKRPGFVEFTGSVQGTNSRGDRFEISSTPEQDVPFAITLDTGRRRIAVIESAGTASFLDADGTERQESFTAPFQSQLTGMVAQEMLESRVYALTPYQESMRLHLPILETFIGHLNKVSGKKYDHCPIT